MKFYISFLLLSCLYCVSAKETACPGCPINADINNKDIFELLKKVVNKHDADSNEEPKKDIVIVKATTQVVAGTRYEAEFNAVGANTGKKYKCKSSWYVQLWMSKEPNMLDYKCSSST